MNKFISISIFVSLLFVILGVMMIAFPQISLQVFAYILATLLLLNGIYLVVADFRIRRYFLLMDSLFPGILSVLCGILLFVYPETLHFLIPILLSVWFIFNSILKMRISFFLKEAGENWILLFLFALFSFLCGILMLLQPSVTSITVTLFAGILLVIYSIFDIIDLLEVKRHTKKMISYFKDMKKIIDE